MILGMSVAAFTVLHVVISLLAIGAGLGVVAGMIGDRRLTSLNVLFLWTTVATSVTGFFFHSKAIGPPHIVGVVSLLVLAIALLAFYGLQQRGAWRRVYVIAAVIALYLNCFVRRGAGLPEASGAADMRWRPPGRSRRSWPRRAPPCWCSWRWASWRRGDIVPTRPEGLRRGQGGLARGGQASDDLRHQGV